MNNLSAYGLLLIGVGLLLLIGATMEYEFNEWSYKWGPRISWAILLVGIVLLVFGWR